MVEQVKRGEPKKHRFSIRVTHTLYEDLRALAYAEHRSIADFVSVTLEKLVAPLRPIEHLPSSREASNPEETVEDVIRAAAEYEAEIASSPTNPERETPVELVKFVNVGEAEK